MGLFSRVTHLWDRETSRSTADIGSNWTHAFLQELLFDLDIFQNLFGNVSYVMVMKFDTLLIT